MLDDPGCGFVIFLVFVFAIIMIILAILAAFGIHTQF